jgi:GNAT superfamily N-acetyltransferase
MNTTVLREYKETIGFLADIKFEVDRQRAALGFLPPAAYEQAAAQGRLWVAVDEAQTYAGHLLFGGTRISIKVFQIAVVLHAQRRGLARNMLSQLEAYAEERGYMSVLAKVAADLPANAFWDRMGYIVIRQGPVKNFV